jgi:hypothetical protein
MKRAILSYGNHRYVLNSAVCIIGRSENCDLIIDDPSVSRRHCVIVQSNSRYVVFDFKSSNGVSFKGESVFQKELNDGDVFAIGDHEIKFSYQEHFTFGPQVKVDNYDGLLSCTDYNTFFTDALTSIPNGNPDDYELIFELNRMVSSINSTDTLVVDALTHVCKGLGAASGFIAVYNSSNREIDIKATLKMDGIKISTSPFFLMLFKQTYSNKHIVSTTDVLYEYLYQDPELIFLDIGSVICAPVFRSGNPFGLIYMDRTMTTAAFSDREKKVLALYSYFFSLALDRLLLEEELRNSIGNIQIVDKANTDNPGINLPEKKKKASIKCEICGENIDDHPASNLVICLTCHTIHHKDCWIYYGSCPIYGCSSTEYKTLDQV